MKNNKIRVITGTGLLCAVAIVLQLLSNYIQFGPVSITLALIPIVVSACIYGPLSGLLVGTIVGAMVCVAPSTLGAFMPFNPFITIVVCLLKTGLAGLIAGFIYKIFKNKHPLVGVILASISVPLINTGLFLGAVFAFFMPLYQEWAGEGADVYNFIIVSVLSINFVIELVVNSVLSPFVYKLTQIIIKKMNIGIKEE